MISRFLNAVRLLAGKALRFAPLYATSLLFCANSYAQTINHPILGSCKIGGVSLGAWAKIQQVDHLTAQNGMVLAEAPVSMNLQFSQQAVPTTVVRGGFSLNTANRTPNAANFYTIASKVPGVGIRMKDRNRYEADQPYLTSSVPIGVTLMSYTSVGSIPDSYEFELVLTDINIFQGGTVPMSLDWNGSFSATFGSHAAWSLLSSGYNRVIVGQQQCFAYYDFLTLPSAITLQPPASPTCEVRSDSAYQLVTMPTFSTGKLSHLKGLSEDFATFSFTLNKCRKGAAPYISLKDLTDPTNTTTNLSLSQYWGDAPKGIAIRLLRKDAAGTWKDVTFGPSPTTLDSSAPNQFAVGPALTNDSIIEIPFRAHYVRTGQVTAGYVEAKAVIEVMYK